MNDGQLLSVLLFYHAPVICIIICTYIFGSVKRNGLNHKQYIMFKLLPVGCVANMLAEVAGGLVIYLDIGIDKSVAVISANISYALFLFNTILFGEFCLSRIEKPEKHLTLILRTGYALSAVCLLVRFFATNTNLFTYVNEEGEVAYGSLEVLQGRLYAACDVVLALIVLLKFLDKKQYVNKESIKKILLDTVIYAVVVVVYSICYFPYLTWVGYMLIIAHTYIGFQSMLIYNDELTSLKNRRRMILDIDVINRDDVHSDDKHTGVWGIAIIDVNSFKQVNDTYGHNEGDKALVIVASVLKEVSKRNNSEAYRTGGDEFALLIPNCNGDVTSVISDEINFELGKRSNIDNLPYELTVSFGAAMYGENDKYEIKEIVDLADAKMYENKLRIKKMKSISNSKIG